jgi:tripartite-type tricarboxylate transporter receptor subunit TctC
VKARMAWVARCVRQWVALGLVASATSAAAAPRDSAAFYASHPLDIVVGSTTGGYYDTAARTISRHLSKFLPGHPQIIVQNDPGAGGLAIANKLAEGVADDGATIVVMSRALPQLALVSDPRITFDPLRATWLGSLSSYEDDGYLLVVKSSSPVRSIEDARGAGKSLVLAGTRAGSTNITFALLARDLLGMNVKVIRGFPGAAEIWLAMDRNEVDGQFVDLSAIMVARSQAWRDKQLRPLLAFGRKTRFPQLPDVPTASELVHDAAGKALLEFAELPFYMALPVVAPAGVPTDRAQALEAAFMNMAADADFRADMLNVGILTSPVDGQIVHDLVERAAQTPADVKAKFAKLLSAP